MMMVVVLLIISWDEIKYFYVFFESAKVGKFFFLLLLVWIVGSPCQVFSYSIAIHSSLSRMLCLFFCPKRKIQLSKYFPFLSYFYLLNYFHTSVVTFFCAAIRNRKRMDGKKWELWSSSAIPWRMHQQISLNRIFFYCSTHHTMLMQCR